MHPSRLIKPVYLTVACLVALVVGIGFGLLRGESALRLQEAAGSLLNPLVSVWLRALTIAAILLAVTYIVVAIAHMRRKKEAGKMVGIAILTHQALMIIAAIFSFSSAGLLVFFPKINLDAVASSIDIPRPPAIDGTGGVSAILRTLLVDPVTAVITGNIMALILWAVVIGWLLSLIAPRAREPVVGAFEFVMRLTHQCVQWLLILMPVAIFHVALILTPGTGGGLIGSLAGFIVVMSGIPIVLTGLLYVLATAVGRVSLRRFAEVAAPVQALAIGTRSSLACLPTVVEAARRLGMPPTVSEIVVPLSTGAMRLSQLGSHPFTACFLAYAYGMHLGIGTLAVFTLGLFLISYGTPGIPSLGVLASLPLYLALGIPIEGYLVLKAVDVIPDCFKTVLNVTEDLTIATIAARFRTVEEVEPAIAAAVDVPATQPASTS